MDYYKVLGIDKNASETEIKKAYRKLAQQHHPDTGSGDETKFKEITQAYEILSDKQKRAQYDQFGSAGPNFGGQGGGFGGFDFNNINVDFGAGGFGDIFDTFFGGGQKAARKKGPARGSDIEMMVKISFEEAVFGVTKEIELAVYDHCARCKGEGAEPGTTLKTCETCSGTGQQIRLQRTPFGQIQTSSICQNCEGAGKLPEKKCQECGGAGRQLKNVRLNAKIPSGIHDQAVLRLTGKGEAGAMGGPYGDLFLHIQVLPSKMFERVKDDIYTTEHVHTLQAIMGDEIKIKTVHGEADLILPAGTQSGSVLKIKDQGVPRVGTSNRGDHYVKIVVDVPKKVSGKEKELYNELIKLAKLNIKPQNKGLFG